MYDTSDIRKGLKVLIDGKPYKVLTRHLKGHGLTPAQMADYVKSEAAKWEKVIKTLGMVNGAPDYLEQPVVINGFSELMRDVARRFNARAPAMN